MEKNNGCSWIFIYMHTPCLRSLLFFMKTASEEKFSLAGLFQRLDNFLATNFDDVIKNQREMATKEKAEMQTIMASLGKDFPQKMELDLTRENHAAVIRELQRMQNEPEYVSQWQPKTLDDSKQHEREATTQKCVTESTPAESLPPLPPVTNSQNPQHSGVFRVRL